MQSAGDQHVSEIALMALALLAGDLIIIIIIIIIIIRPLGSSRRLTLRLGRSARKWEVLIFRYKHTLHHNKYIIIIIIIIICVKYHILMWFTQHNNIVDCLEHMKR